MKVRPDHGWGSDNSASSTRPANKKPRLYLIVVEGMVVGKRADGWPHATKVPPDWVLVDKETFAAASPRTKFSSGKLLPSDCWHADDPIRQPETADERLARLEAVLARLESRMAALEARTPPR